MLQVVEDRTGGTDESVPSELRAAYDLADQLMMRLRGLRQALENVQPQSAETQSVPRASALITAEEAAESLRVSRTVVYALIKNGSLRSVKIGSSRRVPVGAIDEYVTSLES